MSINGCMYVCVCVCVCVWVCVGECACVFASDNYVACCLTVVANSSPQ